MLVFIFYNLILRSLPSKSSSQGLIPFFVNIAPNPVPHASIYTTHPWYLSGTTNTEALVNKCFLTFVGPNKLHFLPNKLSQRNCYLREIHDESPVVASKSKKTSDLDHHLWSLSIIYSFDLIWIDWQSFLWNHMTKKLNLFLPKMTLRILRLWLIPP